MTTIYIESGESLATQIKEIVARGLTATDKCKIFQEITKRLEWSGSAILSETAFLDFWNAIQMLKIPNSECDIINYLCVKKKEFQLWSSGSCALPPEKRRLVIKRLLQFCIKKLPSL